MVFIVEWARNFVPLMIGLNKTYSRKNSMNINFYISVQFLTSLSVSLVQLCESISFKPNSLKLFKTVNKLSTQRTATAVVKVQFSD